MNGPRLLLVLLLVGCPPGEPAPEPMTPQAIEALPDRVARLRALEVAVFGGAWDLDRLEATCGAMGDPELLQACRRWLGRPHLFRGAALERAEPPSRRPGCPGECEGQDSLLVCVVDDALAHPDGPGCACLPQPLARDECWFQVSERLGTQDPPQGDPATEACLAAGALKGPCLHHRAEVLGGGCPPVDGPDLAAWEDVSARVAALESSVAHWDPFERRQLVDVVWAGALRCAFQWPVGFDPGLSTVLPVEALPHLRAALAWHTVAAGRGSPPDLAAWDRALAETLSTGVWPAPEAAPVELPAGAGEGQTHDPTAWALAREAMGEAPCGPVQRYFALGKRFVSPDPEGDRRVALLEAAVRLHPDARVALGQVGSSAEGVLGCTVRSLEDWMARSP